MSTLSERYYVELAAAFVRGHRPDAPPVSAEEVVGWGRGQGLRIHKFKRNAELPRVRRVLGILRSMQPDTLVDVGSGRGTFLWPLLASFPGVQVTAVDHSDVRARDLGAVRRGGVERLEVVQADAQVLPLEDRSADVVTLLEVLEHLPEPSRAAERALAIARRHVIATVPSKADDNPEHIQLFSQKSLGALFLDAGAEAVAIEHIHGHILAVVKVLR